MQTEAVSDATRPGRRVLHLGGFSAAMVAPLAQALKNHGFSSDALTSPRFAGDKWNSPDFGMVTHAPDLAAQSTQSLAVMLFGELLHASYRPVSWCWAYDDAVNCLTNHGTLRPAVASFVQRNIAGRRARQWFAGYDMFHVQSMAPHHLYLMEALPADAKTVLAVWGL